MKYLFKLVFLTTLFFTHTSFSASPFTYTKEISQAELQKTVETMMPKTIKKFILDITFSEPIVDLLANSNELAIQTNIEVKGLNLKGSGVIHLKGSILYNADQGAFYFKNPTIIALKINNLEEQYQAQIQQLAQANIAKVLEVQPVFTLDDADLRQSLAKSVLESVVVKNGKLVLTLTMF